MKILMVMTSHDKLGNAQVVKAAHAGISESRSRRRVKAGTILRPQKQAPLKRAVHLTCMPILMSSHIKIF
jgi:hypothetical protein